MNHTRSMLLAALFVAPLVATAHADLCPPLPVKSKDFCECAVQNYGTKDDTNVTIKLYGSLGVVATCGPMTIEGTRNDSCYVKYEHTDVCGCEVTGNSGSSRASLSVETGGGQSAQAAVECR